MRSSIFTIVQRRIHLGSNGWATAFPLRMMTTWLLLMVVGMCLSGCQSGANEGNGNDNVNGTDNMNDNGSANGNQDTDDGGTDTDDTGDQGGSNDGADNGGQGLTYYIRPDGGSVEQCTGLVDSP